MARIWVILALISSSAYSICEKIGTPNELLTCVVANHGALEVLGSAVEEQRLNIEAVAQVPNPELEMEVGKNFGNGFSTSLTYLHTIELGDKLEARLGVARSEKKVAEVDVLRFSEELKIKTVENLYRIRQLRHEVHVLSETIHTFRGLIKHYSEAGELSPEIAMSKSVFSMALEESRLKKMSLTNEEAKLTAEIQVGIDRSINITREMLPEIKKKWPLLAQKSATGSQIVREKMKLEVAQAKYRMEDTLGWPDIRIGPKFDFEQAGDSRSSVGFAIGIPLPIYHQNEGAIARSLIAVQKRKTNLEFLQRTVSRRMNSLLETYNRIAKALERNMSNYRVNKKHQDLHEMIDRGVVSAPIIIELHRQMMDYYETVHTQELEGVRALWEFYALDGSILNQELY